MNNKTINLKTEIFKQNLYSLINNSDIPIANAYFVFQAIGKELEETYYQAINEENQQLQQENKEENNKEEIEE